MALQDLSAIRRSTHVLVRCRVSSPRASPSLPHQPDLHLTTSHRRAETPDGTLVGRVFVGGRPPGLPLPRKFPVTTPRPQPILDKNHDNRRGSMAPNLTPPQRGWGTRHQDYPNPSNPEIMVRRRRCCCSSRPDRPSPVILQETRLRARCVHRVTRMTHSRSAAISLGGGLALPVGSSNILQY